MSTLAYILSIFQESDVTGGDLKEVNQWMLSTLFSNCCVLLQACTADRRWAVESKSTAGTRSHCEREAQLANHR
jgi:hypothetical protein